MHNNYLIYFIENPSLSSDEKRCTRCASLRKKIDFCRLHGNNSQYEYSTCNQCHIKIKNARKETDLISRKKMKLEAGLDAPMPSISTTASQANASRTLSDLTNLELNDFLEEQSSDNSQETNNSNDANGFIYTLDEVQELIAKQF